MRNANVILLQLRSLRQAIHTILVQEVTSGVALPIHTQRAYLVNLMKTIRPIENVVVQRKRQSKASIAPYHNRRTLDRLDRPMAYLLLVNQ